METVWRRCGGILPPLALVGVVVDVQGQATTATELTAVPGPPLATAKSWHTREA
jgi:hypothetical protein